MRCARWTKDVPWCRSALAEQLRAVGKAAACFSVGMKPKQSTGTSSTEENLRRTEPFTCCSSLGRQSNPVQQLQHRELAFAAAARHPPSLDSTTAAIALTHSLLFHYTPLPIYSATFSCPIRTTTTTARLAAPFPLPPLLLRQAPSRPPSVTGCCVASCATHLRLPDTTACLFLRFTLNH